MTISDWDVCCLDERGRPCTAATELSPAGLQVDVDHDYLYLLGRHFCQPGGIHQEPVAGRLRFGALEVGDVHLVSQPGPRQGVLWVTWFHRGDQLVGITGVCVYGWDGAGGWTGVLPEHIMALREFLARQSQDAWMPSPATFASLGWANALRYNQGDHFMARKLGHAVETTAPGKGDLPLIYQSRKAAALAPHSEIVTKRLAEFAELANGKPDEAAEEAKVA